MERWIFNKGKPSILTVNYKAKANYKGAIHNVGCF